LEKKTEHKKLFHQRAQKNYFTSNSTEHKKLFHQRAQKKHFTSSIRCQVNVNFGKKIRAQKTISPPPR